MNSIEIIENKLNEKSESLKDTKRIEKLESTLALLEECSNILIDDNLFLEYDFTKIIELFNDNNLYYDNIEQIINEIKQVINIRKMCNITSDFFPYSEGQISALNYLTDTVKELLKKYKEEYEYQNNESTNIDENRVKRIQNIINILNNDGKRKYYTKEEFVTLDELFEDSSIEEKKSVLLSLLDTKNIISKRKKEEEKIENVIDLYKDFLPEKEFVAEKSANIFYGLLMKYRKYVVTSINMNNTREILEFFKKEGILEKFDRSALLGISLYGNPSYIKELYYSEIKPLSEKEKEKFFVDTMGTVWIVEKSKIKRKPFRIRRQKETDIQEEDDFFSRFHGVSIEEYKENVKIVIENSTLFSEKYNMFAFESYLKGMTINPEEMKNIMPLLRMIYSGKSIYMRKNIGLSDTFSLGINGKLPITAIDSGNIEDKIHLAIELGLLNPPRDEISREKDKDIILNDQFQENAKKSNLSNQSIRNYYARNLTRINQTSVEDFGYLFYLKKLNGEMSFYNDFFSDKKAGQRSGEYDGKMKSVRNQIGEIIDNNFYMDYYGELIENYYLYDAVIFSNNFQKFTKNNNLENSYFDESILDNEFIKILEENNRVLDVVTYDNEKQYVSNEYIYKFGNVLISRYKVLRNASILKDEFGYLNENMIKSCIVRNSFLDEKDIDMIFSNLSQGRSL